MDLSPLAITLRDSAGMMSFALSYGVDCPLLSVGFIVLMNFGLSAFAVNLLSNVETILSDVLSNRETISWTQQELLKTVQFSSDKFTYIESRIDCAQSTVRDVLRHIDQNIIEYDPDIGTEKVLRRWLVSEKNQLRLRRL